MILGRPSNLWLGTFTALFNVAEIAHVINLMPDAVSAVNIAAGAVIALIAFTNTAAIAAAKNTP